MNESAYHPAALAPALLLRACDVRRSRAGGPGGQNRNKVETAIHLLHRPTGVAAGATKRRSQAENQRVALFRLRVQLALDVRGDFGRGPAPSDLWRSRLHGGRVAINPEHQDFPALLAEALDALAARHFDPAPAAAFLGCTASQLLRLLKHEPRALVYVNQQRALRHQHALR